MAKIAAEKWVEIQRRKWLRNSKTPLQVKFGNDPLVSEFKNRWQNYIDWLDRGNGVDPSEWGYISLASSIIYINDYKDACESFKEGEEYWLLDTIRKLRRKYGKMTLPRYNDW